MWNQLPSKSRLLAENRKSLQECYSILQGEIQSPAYWNNVYHLYVAYQERYPICKNVFHLKVRRMLVRPAA
jgi:hypothetical protein